MKEQKERILNCIESRDRDRDWSYEIGLEAGVVEELEAAPEEKELEDAAAAPYDSDLRTDWWLVGDQDSTGSCVGWAAEAVLRYHFVKQGHPAKVSDRAFSVRQIWMASKETDPFTSHATTFIERAGTSIKTALDVARKYGLVEEKMLKFEGPRYGGSQQAFYMQAAHHRLIAYINLGRNAWIWVQWLKRYGPILTRLSVDKSWMNIGSDGKLLTYQKPYYGGHAVCMVGYRNGEFIVRNSWGDDWGAEGFAFASVPYALAAFTEAYGIVGVLQY